jgi:preprotein translocase subunit SecY
VPAAVPGGRTRHVPGVDVQALTNYFANQRGGGGLLGLYDLFVGGGLSRATVFALGIMPYISASIFVQIGGAWLPQIDKMQKDEEGRKKLTQWTRYITVALAAVQGYGFALFTQGLPGAVATPGFWSFVVPMVLVLVTGAVFVMWLGEQITERGLGNGASLLIFFSIVERFWPGILDTFRFVTTGRVAPLALLVLGLAMVGVVAGVVAITVAARRVMVQIPQKTMARGRQREAAKNFIPLRINTAGVMPIIFAQSVIVVPGAVAQFSGNPALQRVADTLQPGSWLYLLLMAILIVLFTYFYTSIIFNPVDLAENLKKQGGFVPGVRRARRRPSTSSRWSSASPSRGALPDGDRAAAGRDRAGDERAVPVRRHVAPHRRRRGARHDDADAAAPAAAQVRRLHEEGARPLPRRGPGRRRRLGVLTRAARRRPGSTRAPRVARWRAGHEPSGLIRCSCPARVPSSPPLRRPVHGHCALRKARRR